MTGIAGEAGPEAILPLKRMGDGSLGVRMEGSGGTSIFIDARGAGPGVSEEIRQAMREISAEQLRDAAPRIIDASVERQQDLARKGRLST
jgi:phage-related minor tail protein